MFEIFEKISPYLINERIERNEIRQTRSFREEQDIAFQRSLENDIKKEMEEEKKKKEDEIKKIEEENIKIEFIKNIEKIKEERRIIKEEFSKKKINDNDKNLCLIK
jgi:hypothetical protein